MADYIDRNELVENLDRFAPEHFTPLIRTLIEKQSTADVEEVKHGEWIAVPSSDMSTGKAYKCSECGKFRFGCRLPPYCQECGVKMDGGNHV